MILNVMNFIIYPLQEWLNLGLIVVSLHGTFLVNELLVRMETLLEVESAMWAPIHELFLPLRAYDK